MLNIKIPYNLEMIFLILHVDPIGHLHVNLRVTLSTHTNIVFNVVNKCFP